MAQPLTLYEEIMLLALRDREGTFSSGFVEHAVAGAVLADLFIGGQIRLSGKRGDLVDCDHPPGSDDPIIDECLRKISEAGRRATLSVWISRLSKIPKLRQKVALRLCQRGIVRQVEESVLFFFPRTVYPEINPEPERDLIRRLREAILGKKKTVNPRTVALISLAQAAGLLEPNLGKEIRPKKSRIDEIIAGEAFGAAARDAIAAGDAIAAIAAMINGLLATSVASS